MNGYKLIKLGIIINLSMFGLLASFIGLANAATAPVSGQIETKTRAKLVTGLEDQIPLAAKPGLLIPLAAPVTATNDSGVDFETDEDNSFVTGNVLTNDNGATAVDSIDTTGTVGQVTDLSDGTFTYNPNSQFESLAVSEFAEDTFVYTATDGVTFDTAVVTITINGVNDDPTATDDDEAGFTTDEDTTFTTGNVLDNDDDPDSTDTLSVQSIDTSGTVGQVTNVGDGTFTYNPNGQFEALAVSEQDTDTFQYTASDGHSGTDVATVTVTIDGINDGPTDISLSSTSVSENQPGGTPVGNFSTTDPDGSDTHTYTLVNQSPCATNDNNLFTIVGSQLRTVAVFNYKDQTSYDVCVKTDDGNGGTLVKQFEISIIDEWPSVEVTKTADPTSIPEPGGNVDFTIEVENIGLEDALVSIFDDTVFGDLDDSLCPPLGGTTLEPGEIYTCNFTQSISGNAGDTHVNTVSVIGGDDEGHAFFGNGPDRTATVTFSNVVPGISVQKIANPPVVTEPGDDVTFSIFVTNNSTFEEVTLESLTDDIYGNLNGDGTCVANGTKTIAPNGGTYSCSFTQFVAGNFGDANHVNTVTATVADDDGSSPSNQDSASVSIGKLKQFFLPLLFMPEPTELFVNNTTSGVVTFIVRDLMTKSEVTRCTVPSGQKIPCDHDSDGSNFFSPGTYKVDVTAICGSNTFFQTYKSGQQTTQVFCN